MGFLATLSHPSVKATKKSKYDQATLEFATNPDSRELVDGTEAEYDQVTSEVTSSYGYRELVDGTEAEFDQIISDLYKRAEDQCNQIGAIIKSEAECGQVTSEFATTSDNRELVDGTEAECGQVTSEFATSSDSRELVDETEAECGQVTSEFATSSDRRELVNGTEAEYGQVTSGFTPSYDSRELVDGTQAEFDQIILDLYKRVEDQCKQIGAIIKSEAEYGQVTSEFATSCDYRELAGGTEAEFDQTISDLYKRAKDQCNQIISIIKKAFETDLEYADALCDLKIAYEDTREYDFTELQDDETQMRTIKHFRLHIETCDIYAIEQRVDASLVGSCGPLAEDSLKDLNSYDYSDKQNAWVQKNLDKLILWFP